jgi:hypothetical protein
VTEGRTDADSPLRLAGRVLLAVLTAWALLMIVPDLYRVIDPLASAGFVADNDGRIHDVRGPFETDTDSPAWNAGLRVGDRLDLTAMRCLPPRGPACASLLSVVGGMGGVQLVRPGRELVLHILPGDGGESRLVTVVAAPPPVGAFARVVLLLIETAGIAFVAAAAWLVGTRPGAMSWGFFLYAIWFNPGQNFVYYLPLQEVPPLALVHELAASLAHGAACAGFLLFALSVPNDQPEPQWRPLRRALPAVAAAITCLQLLSFANAFGWPTEALARATFLADYAVDGAAVLILLRRRRGMAPKEYQRMRWIIWGCLIGLPAYILAGILGSTSLWLALWGQTAIPQDLTNLLLLLYGVLGWFVFEAVRRTCVVSVAIPLRRITVFGLLLSVPAFFAHHQLDHLREMLHLPDWGWIALASALLFLIGRAHELAVDLADHGFNRTFRRETVQLADTGERILRADTIDEVERLLTVEPLRLLSLASVAVFREADGMLRRRPDGQGWAATDAALFDPHDARLGGLAAGTPCPIDADHAERLGFPRGIAAPTLAVPVRNRVRWFAVALYGPHATGADLSADERRLLGRLADNAVLAYAHAETVALRHEVATLRRQLSDPLVRM